MIHQLATQSLAQIARDAVMAHCIANARASACIHDDDTATALELAAADRANDLVARLRAEGIDPAALRELLA